MTDRPAKQEAREIVERGLACYELIPVIAAALQRRDDELARLREDNEQITARSVYCHFCGSCGQEGCCRDDRCELNALKAQHEAAQAEIRARDAALETGAATIKAQKVKLAEALREIDRLSAALRNVRNLVTDAVNDALVAEPRR